MKTYTITSHKGKKRDIRIKDDVYNALTQLDEREKLDERRETRRHVSLDDLVEHGKEPTYTDEYFADDILANIEDPILHSALLLLTEQQRNLLTRLFVQKQTVTDIAEQDGVAVCSISKRLKRIYDRLRDFM